MTLPGISLLSLCFGYACPPLTLLQLRPLLWYLIVYFRVIFEDLTCGFLSGIQHFTVVYTYAPLLVMIFLLISSHPHGFTHIVWDLFGRFSGSNMFALMFLTLFSLYFYHTYGRALLYKYSCYRPPHLEE